MYESYGKKGVLLGVDLKKIWEKIKEKMSGLRLNLWTAIIIAFTIISIVAIGYTGYATYTAGITKTSSQLLMLESEYAACQSDLSGCNSLKDDVTNLYNTCKSDLNNSQTTVSGLTTEKDVCKSDLNACQSSLGATSSDLLECNKRREQLGNDLVETQSDLTECRTDLNTTEINLQTVQGDFKVLACRYVKEVCRGKEYYYVTSNQELICCKIDDANSCDIQPTGKVEVKEATC